MRPGPLSSRTECWVSSVSMPPMPEPTRTPIRAALLSSMTSPESSTAMSADAIPYWVKRSILRTSLRSPHWEGSKSFTSQAKRTSWLAASKCVMGSAPLTPARAFFQNSPAVFPIGVTAPIPVTTTRL